MQELLINVNVSKCFMSLALRITLAKTEQSNVILKLLFILLVVC